MTTDNYYDVLGLAPGADGAMVDQAYWHLAKSYQRQAPLDPRAEHQLNQLNEAYSVLATPRLRAQYDHNLRTGGRSKERAFVAHKGPRGLFKMSWLRMPFRSHAKPDAAVLPPARAVVSAGSRLAGRDKAEDLHASTAAMLQRWRSNAGIQPASETKNPASPVTDRPEPDMTLVDIFRSEQELDASEDPLASVMDVLRRTKVPASAE
jgi:curved DNA-binding protein CbpA